MANIKSALKRIKVNKTKHDINKSVKSELKTYVKKLNLAIDENNIDEAKELLKLVDKKLKRAAHRNILHKNAAARQMSNLSRRLNNKIKEIA